MSPRGPSAGAIPVAAVLLVLLSAAAAPAAGQRSGVAAVGDLGQIDADTVLLDVSLQPDGDAAWAIRYRVRLDDENDTAAFDSLEADVAANRSAFASRFADRMERTVRAAENATGREMAVRNVSVRTERQEIPQRYGVLVYEFEWTNFAAVDDGSIRAGDAIGGLFLDESTSLTVHWPDGYGLQSADPDPDDVGSTSATWRGPRDFTPEQPRIVLSTAVPTTGGGGGGDGAPEDDGLIVGTPATWIGLAGLVVLVVVLGAGFWWRGRGADASTPAEPASEVGPPDELLSNEERVLGLLEQHGGRMKQQQVVEELGWTDAKTSQVVSELRESGQVDVFRLGRENVLDLPEEDDEDGES
ncbi:MAG TPA: hypothetical protein VKA37_05470 [Halobacteriales archaeon]|nr:hypothetical protein [Halobacteriales archaeon]